MLMKSLQSSLSVTHPYHHTPTHPDQRPSVTGENAYEVLAVPSLSYTSTPSHTHTVTHPDHRPSVTGEYADEVLAVPSLSHTPTQSLSLIIDHPSQTKMLMKSLQSSLSVTHPHSHSP